MSIVACLPLPPTSNNLYYNIRNKGRVKTEEYNAWIQEAGWALATHRIPEQVGKVSILIEVREPPTARREDVACREKASIDLLVRHGVLKDDSQHYVRRITMEWAKNVEGIRITISKWEG